MAEYYPLLSRAVAGLRDGAPEARQAIYGRARQALTGQLRGMQPAVPEEAITKEITALDDAIAKLEAEMAPPPSVSDAASAAVEAALLFDLAPPPPSLQPSAPPRGQEPAASSSVALKPPVSRPAAAAPRVTPRPDRPAFTPRTSLPGSSRLVRQEPPVLPEAPAAGLATGQVDTAEVFPLKEASPPIALPTAPTLEGLTPSREDPDAVRIGRAPDLAVEPADDRAPPVPIATPEAEMRRRDEAVRPAMPRQAMAQPRNLRVWVVAVAALAAVVVIALTAWKLRDKPEELARVPTPPPQADAAPGKIVERADGTAPAEDEADAAQPAVAGTVPQVATPVPVPAAGTTAQPASEQAIPVSYKAAVLVAAPETPEKVRTFVGTVVWRAEGTAAGQDATAATAVRADVDVPDAKLQMTMEIRKNTEAQFPASHTIDIKFTPAPDSSVGSVKQIDVPQMRREDAATGEPLVGVPVTITNNSFLVGLTREAEARNVEALRTRGWFDIPMVLADGKPAKITFEKGASGDRILADALTAWSKSQ